MSAASQFKDAAELLASVSQLLLDTRKDDPGVPAGYILVALEQADELGEAIDELLAAANHLEE
jgi:hypothetical protein